MKKSTQAFLLNLIIGAVVFLPYMIASNGIMAITNDFNVQSTDFGIVINDAVRSGQGIWSPIIDLGSNIVSTFSFYNIASPFYLWTLPFPAEWYPYLIGYAYMMKYAVAGLTSYLYISYYLKEDKKKWAIIGSVLYSFCGFQCVNMIFQFFDAVALFPLLLLAIEKKADFFNDEYEKDLKGHLLAGFGLLSFAVFISSVTNYFIFTEEVLFLLIFYVIRVLFADRVKNRLKFTISVAVEGIIGTAMGALILLPAYVGILGNSRASVHYWGGLFYSTREYLRLVCGVLLPAEPMTCQSYIRREEYSSLSLFLPVVGIALVVCFIWDYFKNRENRKEYRWLVSLLLITGLGVFVPFLNNYYSLWSTPYYRWLFIPSLLMALCSTIVLADKEKYPITIMSIACGGLVIMLGLFMTVWNKVRVETVFDHRAMWLAIIVTVAGYLLLSVWASNSKSKQGFISVLLLICIFSVYYNSNIIYRYKANNYETANDFYNKIAACRQLKIEGFGRVETEPGEDLNLALVSELPGRKSFCSTVSYGAMDFYESMGLERKSFTPDGPKGTKELLSTRYLLSRVDYTNSTDDSNLKMIDGASYGNMTYYLYEYADYLPMGLVYHEYVTKSEYMTIDPSLRSLCMLKYLVIDDNDEDEVSEVLAHGDIALVGDTDVKTLMEERKSAAQYIEDSYSSAEVICEEPSYIFFSIPFEKGWTARVNGEDTDIININGLMGIRLQAGDNHVELSYKDRLFEAALIISAISVILCVAIMKGLNSERKDKDK